MNSFSLDFAGLVALADLSVVQQRTALSGTAILTDCLVLCPGIHLQQKAVELNRGEYPACASLTGQFVFRVENPATVYFLQRVGCTGQLTTIKVVAQQDGRGPGTWLFPHRNSTWKEMIPYGSAVWWTLVVLGRSTWVADYWGTGVIGALICTRICNVLVVRRRCQTGWQGASEPGVRGDLLILLSQDRWIRMQGLVDDLKAVTSGQWMQDPVYSESLLTSIGTILVYLAAALASNVNQLDKILLLTLLLGSAGLLALTNMATDKLTMHDRTLTVSARKPYKRRLELAEELIKETGKREWAEKLGMVNRQTTSTLDSGEVTM